MPVVPSGILSLPAQNCKVLIANCPAWQAWCGKASAADVMDRIHLFDLPAPDKGDGRAYERSELSAIRPHARIHFFQPPVGYGGESWTYDRRAQGQFVEGGKLAVDFLADVPQDLADDPAGAMLDFTNKLGAVWEEMLDLGGGDTEFLSIHRVELFEGPLRADQTIAGTQGDFFAAKLVVRYGL